jgi:hypothetical protein
MTCKEKAELTYKALQKRKERKNRKKEQVANEVHFDLVNRCQKISSKKHSGRGAHQTKKLVC